MLTLIEKSARPIRSVIQKEALNVVFEMAKRLATAFQTGLEFATHKLRLVS
jgi:hypothetical protein